MTATDIVQSVAVVSAIVALGLGWRQEALARDLAIVLDVGREYRRRWEEGWRDTVNQVEKRVGDGGDPTPLGDERTVVLEMLNWIDWLGILVQNRLFHRPQVVFETVGPSISRILVVGDEILRSDEKEYGCDHWSGVNTVADRLAGLGIVQGRRPSV